MQKKRRHPLFHSPKAFLVYALAMLLLPLPYSTLQAGGPSRTTQGKSDSSQRPPASNAHRRPQARPTPPPAAPAPRANNRNTNRSSPSSSNNNGASNAHRRPQPAPPAPATPPSSRSSSQPTRQPRQSPATRVTPPPSRPQTAQRPETRQRPVAAPQRQPRSETSPSRATVTRATTTTATTPHTRIGPQRPETDSAQVRSRTTRTTVTRANREPQVRPSANTTRSNIAAVNRTRAHTPSRAAPAATRPRRDPSNRERHDPSTHPGRQPTVEASYEQNRDVAQDIYIERRRNSEAAADRRREYERQRVVRALNDGGEKQEIASAHPKTTLRQQLQDRASNADRDQGPHNDRHGNHTTRRHQVEPHHHRHGSGCGHHFYDNRWHDYPRQHRHYDGCGHLRRSGAWISFSIGHVHGTGCGHFFDDGVWLSYSGSRHFHHAGCGHYYYDGFWNNTSRYHVHGTGCGHYFYDNRWNDFPHAHVHTDYCDHIYDGSRWLVASSDTHVHNASCGHYQISGQWYAYPRNYYTMNRENSLYFFVDLGDYRNRNIPEWAYQAYLQNGGPTDIFRSSSSLAKAYAAFAKGRYYDSLAQFKVASKLDRDNGLVYLARAQAQIAVKDYRSAFDDIVKGMALFPEWADAYVNLSEIYSRAEDLEKHSLQLKQWVERYPRDYKAHFVLGYFYYFHQEYDAAKNELLYALSWDDDLEAAHLLMDKILEFEAESEVLTLEQEASPEEEAATTTE